MQSALKEVFNVHRNVVRDLRHQLQVALREKDELKNRINHRNKQLKTDISKLKEEICSLWTIVEKHRDAGICNCLQSGKRSTSSPTTYHGAVQSLDLRLLNLEQILSSFEESCKDEEKSDARKPSLKLGQTQTDQPQENQPAQPGSVELVVTSQGCNSQSVTSETNNSLHPEQRPLIRYREGVQATGKRDKHLEDGRGSQPTTKGRQKERQESHSEGKRIQSVATHHIGENVGLHDTGKNEHNMGQDIQHIEYKVYNIGENVHHIGENLQNTGDDNERGTENSKQQLEQNNFDADIVSCTVKTPGQRTSPGRKWSSEGYGCRLFASSGRQRQSKDGADSVTQSDCVVAAKANVDGGSTETSPEPGTKLQLARNTTKRRRYTENESMKKAKRPRVHSKGSDMDERPQGHRPTDDSVSQSGNSISHGKQSSPIGSESHQSGNDGKTVVRTETSPIILVPDTLEFDVDLCTQEEDATAARKKKAQSPASFSLASPDKKHANLTNKIRKVLSANPRIDYSQNRIRKVSSTNPSIDHSQNRIRKVSSTNPSIDHSQNISSERALEGQSGKIIEEGSLQHRTKTNDERREGDRPNTRLQQHFVAEKHATTNSWPTDSVVFGATTVRTAGCLRSETVESGSLCVEEEQEATCGDLQSPVFVSHISDGGDQSPALFDEVGGGGGDGCQTGPEVHDGPRSSALAMYHAVRPRTSSSSSSSSSSPVEQFRRMTAVSVSPTSPALLQSLKKVLHPKLSDTRCSKQSDSSPLSRKSPQSPPPLGVVHRTDLSDVHWLSSVADDDPVTSQALSDKQQKRNCLEPSPPLQYGTPKRVQQRRLFRSRTAQPAVSVNHSSTSVAKGNDPSDGGGKIPTVGSDLPGAGDNPVQRTQLNASIDPAITLTQYLKDSCSQKDRQDEEWEDGDETLNPNCLRAAQDISAGCLEDSPSPQRAVSVPQISVMPSLEDSFDRVPQRVDSRGYAFAEVVRKQADRKKLNAFSCQDCEKYYKAMGLSDTQKREKMAQCSRHRARHAPPSTPEHFWSVGFPDSYSSQ